MKTQTIIVPEDRCIEMARLGSEVDSRKNLIAFMISNDMNTTSTQFNRYQTEYNNYFSQYEEKKRAIENEFVKPIIGSAVVNWNLDFFSHELTITYKE